MTVRDAATRAAREWGVDKLDGADARVLLPPHEIKEQTSDARRVRLGELCAGGSHRRPTSGRLERNKR